MSNIYIGIDIGSTSTKTIAIDSDKKILYENIRPTGFSGKDVALNIKKELDDEFSSSNLLFFATGYGRVAVPFAKKTITEITCHAKGAGEIYKTNNINVIDIGGQDTKIIVIEEGQVKDFLMNDKCSAGTGRFLEVMATTLGVGINELFDLAKNGKDVVISSLCTVFAESEIISLIGKGETKENIAFGVVNSVIDKVSSQGMKIINKTYPIVITGGLSGIEYIRDLMSKKFEMKVFSDERAKIAGALGAAILAMESNL